MSPALAGGFLTTAPPGKSQEAFLNSLKIRLDAPALCSDSACYSYLHIVKEHSLQRFPWFAELFQEGTLVYYFLHSH